MVITDHHHRCHDSNHPHRSHHYHHHHSHYLPFYLSACAAPFSCSALFSHYSPFPLYNNPVRQILETTHTFHAAVVRFKIFLLALQCDLRTHRQLKVSQLFSSFHLRLPDSETVRRKFIINKRVCHSTAYVTDDRDVAIVSSVAAAVILHRGVPRAMDETVAIR